MKKCPYCAEPVQDDTLVCPHCRMNLTTNVYAPQPTQPNYSQQSPVQPGLTGDAYPTAQPETSGKATGSLIAGVSAYVILPFVGAIIAIILGHLGLSEIKKSAGRLKGDGLAVAGLVLGYIQFALIPFILIIAAIAIPNLIRARTAANEASAVGSLRTITTAEISYSSSCPRIGFAHRLTELGPNGSSCPQGANQIDRILAAGTKNGYRFTPHISSFTGQVPETDFGWNADPVTESSGTKHFFVDETGVIRFSKTGPADQDSDILQ